jgi:hypothetical protein
MMLVGKTKVLYKEEVPVLTQSNTKSQTDLPVIDTGLSI